MVLGWWKELEGRSKVIGRKRKTVFYWKRLMNEAGRDYTEVEQMTSDRDRWKSMVTERMEHLYKWECQGGHKYEWRRNERRMERNKRRMNTLVCRYEGCEKVCKSRAGLTMHEKRMHRVNEERVMFACSRCGMSGETEGARKNLESTCSGGARRMDGRRECGKCGKLITNVNYVRHVRTCRAQGRAQ